MDHDTRRLAIVHVDYHAILDAFARPAPFRHAYFSDHPQLPKGCEVVEVREDPCRRCFAFTITHPDLPEVPDGSLIPHLFDEPVTFTCHELVREADGRYRITPDLPLPYKTVTHTIDVGAEFGHWDIAVSHSFNIKRTISHALGWVSEQAMRAEFPPDAMMLAMSTDDARRLEASEELTIYNLAHGVRRFRHLKMPRVLYSVPVSLNYAGGLRLQVFDNVSDTSYEVRFTNVFTPEAVDVTPSGLVNPMTRDQLDAALRAGVKRLLNPQQPEHETARFERSETLNPELLASAKRYLEGIDLPRDIIVSDEIKQLLAENAGEDLAGEPNPVIRPLLSDDRITTIGEVRTMSIPRELLEGDLGSSNYAAARLADPAGARLIDQKAEQPAEGSWRDRDPLL